MATTIHCAPLLTFDLEENPKEVIVYCHGRITAESAELFQSEVRDQTIPASRGKGLAVIGRIVLDLSDVTRIDNEGLRALLAVWTAGQQKNCSVEIVNLPGSGKRPSIVKLDRLLSRIQALFA